MVLKQFLLALLVGSAVAFPFSSRADDATIAKIITDAKVPQYVAPDLNRDITDWLAIGDSFSAGISADVPSDLLQWSCSRFRMSYPNQMNGNSRLPGHSTSRTFVFGACTGDKMQDVMDKQLELGTPNLGAAYPRIGNPQIETVSIAGNDLGFGEIVNACIYHWVGYGDCNTLLKAAHAAVEDPGRAFEYKLVQVFAKIMARARTANPNFQLYVTGYIPFWNADNPQCDTISWTPKYRADVYLTTTLRRDMNELVDKLNVLLKEAANAINDKLGGVYYVEGFQQKFEGHRFCEVESNVGYLERPVGTKTWFIHYQSPYKDPSSATGSNFESFFDEVDSIFIPPKDGKSTSDQIKAVNGNLAKLNPAYESVDSMTAALMKLGGEDSEKSILPITWLRIMHPKGSGYATMADAVIDSVLEFGAKGASSSGPTPPQGGACTGTGVNKFLALDDLKDKTEKFCTRYEVDLSMDWPSGLDIKNNMESNCKGSMKTITDSCDGNDPQNPLDWKHGGHYQLGQVKYNIVPTRDQGYKPGKCSFHLQEDEQGWGYDGPGTQRTAFFQIEKGTLNDGGGTVISTLGFASNGKTGAPIAAGDKHSLSWNFPLPYSIVITPEAAGDPRDYIQFSYGSQSWTSSTDTGMPYCKTGGFTTDTKPANRNMDCFFSC